LSKEWFDDCSDFYNGFGIIKQNRFLNYIDKNGNILCSGWFNSASAFHDGFALVGGVGGERYINTKGEFVDEDNFE
jgi:hypothetical protein